MTDTIATVRDAARGEAPLTLDPEQVGDLDEIVRRERANADAAHAAMGRALRVLHQVTEIVTGKPWHTQNVDDLPAAVAAALGRPCPPAPLVPPPHRPDAAPEVVALGEDGEMLAAYGHVDLDLFTILCVSHVARTGDITLAQDLAAEGAGGRHAWAVERTLSAVGRAADLDQGCAGVEPGDRYVSWADDVTQETPGAFPVTYASPW